MFHYLSAVFESLCLGPCMWCTECLICCSCTVITSMPEANGPFVCWFCLVLCQWFFFSGRMSALCAWPSLRTLDVILSTWSLHYLLSSTMLPSRCSATWNAWLASSLKPSWNCVLNRRRLFLLSLSSLQPCVQEPERDSSSRTTAAQSTGKHTKQSSASLPPFTSHSFYLIYWCLYCLIHCSVIQVSLMDTYPHV